MSTLAQLLAQDLDRLVDEALADLAPVGQHLDQLAVALGLEVLEGEVLELPLDLPHPQPMGQRGVDLHGLARDAGLLLHRQEAQGAHVVEPIGELDDDHPHVLGHGHEHLPDVLGLLLLHGPRGAELGELGDPVDQATDLAPEALLDLLDGHVGVFGDVVEECCGQRLRVHLERGQVVGDLHRMLDVGLARRPQLPLVRLLGDAVGTLDQADVDARPMLPRFGDNVLDRMGRLCRRLRARDALHYCGRSRPQAG